MTNEIKYRGLICNNLYKGSKNFENWKQELRNSLAFDLLVDLGKGNTIRELFAKIFNFSVSHSRVGVTDITPAVSVL